MKINSKSKVANISSVLQHSCSFLRGGYFSSSKETKCHHSEPIMVFCRRRMMENKLANGLVIYLIVPYLHIKAQSNK